MARPSEKAKSTLNRYLRDQGGRRPALASDCNDVAEAVKWRGSVERDMRSRISEIRHAGHGAARIRELNDAINRLLRARRHWNRRVVELGGKPLTLRDPDATAFTHGGYRYFGAARELPEVRELVERAASERRQAETDEQPAELYARLDDAYYNAVYDDADIDAVAAREKQLKDELAAQWKGGHDAVWNDDFLKYKDWRPNTAS